VAAGTCDCETGDGTFSIAAGIAQTTIGVPASSTTPSTPTHNGNTLSSSGLSPSATGQAASKASAPPVPSTHKAGFKAGISILVVIVVLGLLATGFFFWRRRQRRNELLAPPQNDDDSDIFNMQAMASVFSNARLEPDPYQLPSPSHIPRGPSRTSGPDPTRFSPPINDPYQYPYGRT
jgi:hypothetical protein